MSNIAHHSKTHRQTSSLPQTKGKEWQGAATVWIILTGVIVAHLLVLLQFWIFPQYCYLPDKWFSIVILLCMFGLALANLMHWITKKTVFSMLIIMNMVFLLTRFGFSLFVVGSIGKIQTELSTFMIWSLTIPMLAVSVKVTRLAKQASIALPFVILLMSLAFFGYHKFSINSEIWFGLIQLILVSFTVLLSAQSINKLRAALKNSIADNNTLS